VDKLLARMRKVPSNDSAQYSVYLKNAHGRREDKKALSEGLHKRGLQNGGICTTVHVLYDFTVQYAAFTSKFTERFPGGAGLAEA
jgi:hypothetical protein